MKKLLIASALTALALPAAAETSFFTLPSFGDIKVPRIATAQRFTAEVLVGSADQGVNDQEGSASARGFRASYRIAPKLDIEAGRINYGSASWSTVNVKTTSNNIGVKFTYPFHNGFAAVGRAGFAFWDAKGRGAVVGGSDSGTDPYIGAGLQYTFNHQFFSAIEWTRADFKTGSGGNSGDLEVEMLALNLGYRF